MGGFGDRRSKLLPMMCSKPSIKEVIVPKCRQRPPDEPPSPRVGCMGQVVKRSNSSRVIAYPTPCLNHFLKLPKNNCNLRAQIKQRIKTASVADMDPPLPVIKKRSTPKPESLWKRRSKGRKLQIHVCPNLLLLDQPKSV